jgi:hypothetical protein
MLALAAPALAHAAGHGHGQHEAHRRQVAHMYAYEERQLGGLLGGGAASTGSVSLCCAITGVIGC